MRRSGRMVTSLAIALGLFSVVGGLLYFFANAGNGAADQAILLQTVERGDFEAFVTERGDVSSSSNVEIRCRVRARGAPGSSILKICDEGELVQPGDFLVQFDDSLLQQELLAQRIVAANNKALLIQAQSTLDSAKRELREYTEGLFAQERDVLDAAKFVAEENLQRAVTYLEHSRRLVAKGYITANQLRADEFAVDKAKKELAIAQQKLKVYDQFTRDKMVGKYEAEIKKQEAKVEAAQHTLDLSEQKLLKIEEQISYCMITAPSAGQVVHANERDRGGNTKVIEEGTLIRENQIIIRLPDLENMQVDVKINESHVNRVAVGQPARIILNADHKEILRGTVTEVAPYPFPIRWHGAPLEYGAVVSINDPPPNIRPGLRAKVTIVFETQPDVLQVPLAAVIEQDERHYCLVREQDDWRLQPVKVGSNNNDQIIVIEGLTEGDQVSMTPFRHIERSDLPESPSGTAVVQQHRAEQPDKKIDKPDVSRTVANTGPAS